MASKVVICSPLTLFAFLGVIRQAFDNFVIEETSQEILQLLGKFGQQWGKYTEQVDKVKRSTICVASNSCPSMGSCSLSTRRASSTPSSTTCANSAPDGPDFPRESGGVRLRRS